jgi:hypothetical protein
MKVKTIKFKRNVKLDLIEVGLMSEKGQHMYRAWKWESMGCRSTNLYDVYKKPSPDKRSAWCAIFEECQKAQGDCLAVTGWNLYKFSAAYTAFDAKGDPWLIYHTPTYRYGICLSHT